MIKDLVNQENLKLSNAVSTAKGFVATHKNVIGGLPPVSLMLGGKCEQNGTPAPDNKVDIVGAGESGSLKVVSCDKNLFDESRLLNATGWTLTDGYYTGTSSSLFAVFKRSEGGFVENLKRDKQYTISLIGKCKENTLNNANILVTYYGTEERRAFALTTTDAKYVFTTSADKEIKSIAFHYGTSETIYIKEFQIEESAKATPYEPYTGTEVNIPLSAPLYESDTITYNMTGSGEESRVMGVLDLGDLIWNYNETYGVMRSTSPRWYTKAKSNTSGTLPNMKCTSYITAETISSMGSCDLKADKTIFDYNGDNGYLIVKDTSYTDATEFKEAVKGVKLVYEMAEPTVTPLTTPQITAIESLLSQDGLCNVMSEGMVESAYFANNADGKAVVLLNEIIKTNYLKSAKGYELEDLDKSVNNFKTQNQQEHGVFTGEIDMLKGRVSALELNGWTRLGNVTTLDLSSYKEVLVVLDDGDGHDVTINIPKYELEEAKNSYGSGAYLTSALNWGGYITMDDVGVYDKKFYVNGALSGICNVSIYVR